MSQDINSITIVGRLTKDGELKYTNSGTAICKFSIAMNKSYKQGDEWKESSIFVNDLTLWGKRAEGLNQYLTKGQQVAISGSLDMDTWQDKDTGKNRSKLKVLVSNVQLLGGKRDSSNSGTNQKQENKSFDAQGAFHGNQEKFEDDIPF